MFGKKFFIWYNFFDVTKNEAYRVFVGETFDSKMLLLDFAEGGDVSFTIGNSTAPEKGKPNYISYENPIVHYNQLEITRQNNIYYLKMLYEAQLLLD